MPIIRDEFERIPVDPRIVQDIQTHRKMRDEQGSTFMTKWGGPSEYSKLASMPAPDRLVLMAVKEGYATPATIADVTGLPVDTVNSRVSILKGQGLIEKDEVSKEVL